MFWMLNWILACPILVWTEANVFSSDLGDTNANALEQITMETAVKKVKFEAGCKFWDRNLVWHYFHIFLLQNVRQDWVPTLLECPKNHQIFHLIVWLFENSLKCKWKESCILICHTCLWSKIFSNIILSFNKINSCTLTPFVIQCHLVRLCLEKRPKLADVSYVQPKEKECFHTYL